MIIYIGRDWPGKAAAAANKIPSERFREKKKKIYIYKEVERGGGGRKKERKLNCPCYNC